MHTRTHKWFLIMIALSLAVAPLRGTWAIAMPAGTDAMPHCAMMGMQPTDTMAGMHQQDNETGHKCERGCNGACCNGACNACAHAASTILDNIIVTPELNNTPLGTVFLTAFPERTVIPLLRPPAFLHS